MIRQSIAAIAAALFLLAGSIAVNAASEETKNFIIVRNSAKTPEATVEAMKAYIEQRQWPLIAIQKVYQDRITLVKFCVPEIGNPILASDLKLSALLPCGNISVYVQDGKTQVSALDPHYMVALDSNPVLVKAADDGRKLLDQMLDETTK